MKHLFTTFAGIACTAMGVMSVFPASAGAADSPTVRPGDFHCFHGMPASQINYIEPSAGSARKMMRVPKLEDNKYDNFDGHHLREVPCEGDYHVLVVLVEFKDAKFTQGRPDTRGLIDNMLNGENYVYQNATGSANQFYRTISNGNFNPIFDVVGPILLDQNEETYVTSDPNDTYPNPEDPDGTPITVYRPGRMVEQALEAIDGDVDFSKYDSNNDGYVDFVYFFFAGKGATTGGGNKTIWPHAFTLTSAIGGPVEHDGVLINRYATSAELGVNNRLSGIGTFCHEFGHVLGLPDLYDTANNNGQASKCFTPGSFDCMDAGNYNNDEKSPATFSSYERYALEWMKPVTLTGGGHFTMLPLEAHPFGYKVNTPSKDTEYYLLENRGSTYYDQYLEGHGLLVWHIDFNLSTWDSNVVNNNKDHQNIDIIEADNEKSASTRYGDTFPGKDGICEFTSTVTPAFKDWSNKPVGFELEKIRYNFDGTTEFDVVESKGKVMEGIDIAAPAPVVSEVSENSISIQWPAVKGAQKYYVSVFPTSAMQGENLEYKDYVEGYCFLPVENPDELGDNLLGFTITGLEANVNYSVMLYAAGEVNASRMQTPVTASTIDAADFENASTNLRLENADNTVVAIWDNIAGADNYDLSVVLRNKGADSDTEINCDFTGNKLPEGWSMLGRYDTRSNYYGESAPSIRLLEAGSYLLSPIYNECIKEISFWGCRRRSFEDGLCSLNVYVADKNGKYTYWKSIDDIAYPGNVITLDCPGNVYGVKFIYNFISTGLDINIDDMKITFCQPAQDVAVNAEIESLDNNSAAIRSLQEGVDYIAYVTPSKDGKPGAKSNEIKFRLEDLPASGVDEIADIPATDLFSVIGTTLIPADAAAEVDVYTIDGQVLTANHKGSFTFPSRGIYVIRINGRNAKISI